MLFQSPLRGTPRAGVETLARECGGCCPLLWRWVWAHVPWARLCLSWRRLLLCPCFWHCRVHPHTAPSRTYPEINPLPLPAASWLGKAPKTRPEETLSPRSQSQSTEPPVGDLFLGHPFSLLLGLWAFRTIPSWPMKPRINKFAKSEIPVQRRSGKNLDP